MFADWREEAPLLPSPPPPPPAGFERPRRREAIPAIQVSCGVAVAVGVVVLISFLFFFPEEKTSLIIINVCCVVFFSLAPKRRIHPRERNVRDQRHFVAETYLRDGHRGWRRVWGEHSHFCGELSTSKRRMMCSRNFCTNDTREREREREGIRRRVTGAAGERFKTTTTSTTSTCCNVYRDSGHVFLFQEAR